MQKKVFEYQQGLQQTIFEREDSAAQRRAADLKAAGLSKTLAAGGGAGAGQVVSVKAPQFEGRNPVESYLSAKQALNAMTMQDQQVQIMKAQKAGLDLDNTLKAATVQGKIDLENAQSKIVMETMADKIIALRNEYKGEWYDYLKKQEETVIAGQRASQETYNTYLSRIKYEIASKYGLTQAEQEYMALMLANEAATHDINFWKKLGLPTNAASVLSSGVSGAGSILRSLIP